MSAYDNDLGTHFLGNLVAAADLSDKKDHVVQIDANGAVSLPTGQGVRCLGVLKNTPKSGEACSVQVVGVSRVKFDANVSHVATGANVAAADTSGEVAVAASGDFVVGVTLEDGTADAFSSILLTPGAIPLA